MMSEPLARAGPWQRAAPLLLLLALFGMLVFSVGMKSPTTDEQNHIARGLAYLKTGDLRLSQEHPPGVNVWEAWPLLLDPEIRLPLDSPSWANAEWYGFADRLLWRVNDRPQTMVFAARVPVMWLTVVLAALVYRWARDLGGEWGGLIALTMLAFDPNILAHGRLTTTDMGVTCLAFAAMYDLRRALQKRNWRRWFLAGVSLGAAQLSKFSALVLGPLVLLSIALAWAGGRFRATPVTREPWHRWAARLLVLFGVGFVVLWGGYGLTWGPIASLGGIPGPAPAYWSGLQVILQRTGGGSPAFLMGHYSSEGWWYYFPVAFALKTPLPTLALLALAIGLWAGGRSQDSLPLSAQGRGGGCAWCLVLPVLGFWGLAVGGSFDIGYRHILPTLPFLYVLAGAQTGRWMGSQFSRLSDRGSVRQLAPIVFCCALMLWLIVETLTLAPHYLAFFNQIAGGPEGGYRFLVDSNLDWGQDLPGLKEYVERRGGERIYLSWFGAAHPEAYGFPFHPLPGFWRFGGEPAAYGFNPYAPAPGLYAISVSNLQGVAFADHDRYAWFRERQPVANIGHSIRIYEVGQQGVGDEALVLGMPMARLVESEGALLQRVPSIRQFDPESGRILPLAADSFWTIVPQPEPEAGHVVRQGPEYVVLYSSDGSAPFSDIDVRFGPFVRMLGYQAREAPLERDRTLLVQVQWLVEQAPHRAAVSFAHLLDGEGRYLAGWDGLTAPATCWQRGDLIVQRYAISLPPDLAPGSYPVEIGWYDQDTVQRWTCYAGGQTIGDRYVLPGVEIVP